MALKFSGFFKVVSDKKVNSLHNLSLIFFFLYNKTLEWILN